MSLVDAYHRISTTLLPQVQGTCGIYSFYNAVQILRDINRQLPTVPAPKKCEAAPGASESLRQRAKRELKSGQGEILTEAEMTAFIKTWKYRCECATASGSAGKKDFLNLQTRGGHPVLIPYLADQDTTGIIPVPNAAAGDPGAHWSLVIGIQGTKALVVEPNAPKAPKEWPLDGLLQANAAADGKKFNRFWAKTETSPDADFRRFDPDFRLPKHQATGIEPVSKPKQWAPSSGPHPYWAGFDQAKTKLYDLGGETGSRQDRQKLAHVLIAVVPP